MAVLAVLCCLLAGPTISPQCVPAQQPPGGAAEPSSGTTPDVSPSVSVANQRFEGRTPREWAALLSTLELQGPESKALAPALSRLVADIQAPWVTRRQAAFTLGRMGPAAAASVPMFRDLLTQGEQADEPDSPRLWALKAIALLGPVARDATPEVIGILHEPATPALHRLAALEALAKIGATSPATLPEIAACLRPAARPTPSATDNAERLEFQVVAAELIGLYGRSAATAIPLLVEASRSDHEPLRRAAVTSLGGIGSDLALEPLTESLVADEDPAVQDAAAISLSRLGASGVIRLTSLLKSDDPQVRWRAADGLGRAGAPAAAKSVPELKQHLADPDPLVRMATAEALWLITKSAPDSLLVALDLFPAGDRDLRMRAHRLVVAIGRGPNRPAVIERLAPLVDSRDPRIRQTALLTLRELEAK